LSLTWALAMTADRSTREFNLRSEPSAAEPALPAWSPAAKIGHRGVTGRRTAMDG
jgi:hypothetical protein